MFLAKEYQIQCANSQNSLSFTGANEDAPSEDRSPYLTRVITNSLFCALSAMRFTIVSW